jgi:hypothetical protein
MTSGVGVEAELYLEFSLKGCKRDEYEESVGV